MFETAKCNQFQKYFAPQVVGNENAVFMTLPRIIYRFPQVVGSEKSIFTTSF